jgi:TPR repeat protein
VPEAINWYMRASESGSPAAAYNLGQIYEHGTSVEQDDRQAFDWYNRAAELENNAADVKLARYYDRGLATPRNVDEGVRRMLGALEASEPDAMDTLLYHWADWSAEFRTQLQEALRNQGWLSGKTSKDLSPELVTALRAIFDGAE